MLEVSEEKTVLEEWKTQEENVCSKKNTFAVRPRKRVELPRTRKRCTLNSPISGRCSTALICPSGYIAGANRTRKSMVKVGISVTAHQKYKKNKKA